MSTSRTAVLGYENVLDLYRGHAYSLRRTIVLGGPQQHAAMFITFFHVRLPCIHHSNSFFPTRCCASINPFLLPSSLLLCIDPSLLFSLLAAVHQG